MMDWESIGSSFLSTGVEIRDEKNDGVYRAVLVAPIIETSPVRHEARLRLAAKLERIADELRRDELRRDQALRAFRSGE